VVEFKEDQVSFVVCCRTSSVKPTVHRQVPVRKTGNNSEVGGRGGPINTFTWSD